jgi:ribosomal 30S subunit maturation factor RimM
MTSDTQDLVGLEAYARDGEKIGKVEDVFHDPEGDAEDCLVIKYGLFRDLIVPVGVVRRQGESITLPLARSALDFAPRVGTKGELTSNDRERLAHFFHPHSSYWQSRV